jgi:hypothetical protein
MKKIISKILVVGFCYVSFNVNAAAEGPIASSLDIEVKTHGLILLRLPQEDRTLLTHQYREAGTLEQQEAVLRNFHQSPNFKRLYPICLAQAEEEAKRNEWISLPPR